MSARGWRKWTWDRLLDQIQPYCLVDLETGCLVWQHGTDRDGYPKLYIDGRHWRGNRAVLFAATGEVGAEAMHSCDNPPCMALGHLRWGTTRENTADAFSRGRRSGNFRPMYGTTNGRSKLTDAQKREILVLSSKGESSGKLATAFGVNRSTIQLLLRQSGASWPAGRPKRTDSTLVQMALSLPVNRVHEGSER
jgi:hypothetical protein